MIQGLTPLHAAHRILAKLSKMEINALLQLGIEVLERKGDGTYTVRMGNQTFQTKSEIPLAPAKEYWVDIERTKEGVIHLTKPHPKPAMLKKDGFLPIGERLLADIAEDSDPAEGLKERIMQMMAAAQSKESFQSLSQLLLSLHHGVVTIPFEERGRRALLQMRKGESGETLNEKSVEFYAAFNNLGPVEGAIARHGEKRVVKLEVFYPKTARLLEDLKGELPGFSQVTVALRPSAILPFWENDTLGLLDIRG